MSVRRWRARLLACVLSIASFVAPVASADTEPSAWPDRVVTFEALTPLTPFTLRVPGLVAKGAVVRPAVLRVHVDTSGAVARTVLMQSSGNADLDESALHAMQEMTFKPYQDDGRPVDVTLVVPVHVPKRFGRSW